MTHAMASLLGFLAPPLIQKYGLRTTAPDAADYMGDLWEPAATAALGAVLGVATRGPLGGLAGAAIGGWAGKDVVNTARLFIDTGKIKNPYTEDYGVSSHDLFVNNLGAFKSYRLYPETELLNNEMLKEMYGNTGRKEITKRLNWALANTQPKSRQAPMKPW